MNSRDWCDMSCRNKEDTLTTDDGNPFGRRIPENDRLTVVRTK